ncbi:MAG: DUF3990 domain-containing protein [Bacilli bacterium]|nr:DUF3990 domain-containing protein [Bacilli bacterium]
MILYHGSNVAVEDPKIIQSVKGKDFGSAFYLTPIKEQAERMAIRKKRMTRSAAAIVSAFEFDTKRAKTFRTKTFAEADMDWLEMIIKCRTDSSYRHGYDIVKGKIADDSVGETILYVIEGVMKKEDAIERLKFQKINSQLAFCTEESLSLLKFVSSYEVK